MDERFERRGVRLVLKRDDLIHPELIGNKWRKLAPNLSAATGRTVLTFGGAYSNHLRATAAAGRLLGLPTVGVVRGQELAGRPLNASLARCVADGMRLHFVDRATYRDKTAPATLAAVLREAGAVDAYVVPEGGSNALAVRGCRALGEELAGRADVVATACGTGGTLAGLASGLGRGGRALGVPVLKGGFLAAGIRGLQAEAFGGPRGDWSLDDRFHFGGYARTTRNSTRSPRISSAVTAYPSNVSMSPNCFTLLSSWSRKTRSRAGARSRPSSPGALSRERAGLWARASGCFPRCPREDSGTDGSTV